MACGNLTGSFLAEEEEKEEEEKGRKDESLENIQVRMRKALLLAHEINKQHLYGALTSDGEAVIAVRIYDELKELEAGPKDYSGQMP